jgi:hypothetical protein
MNEKTMTVLLIIIMFMLIFISQENHMKEGSVIEKLYQESTSDLELTPSAGGMRPSIVRHPEKWILVIKDQDRRGECSIPEDVWNIIDIGKWINCSDLNNHDE